MKIILNPKDIPQSDFPFFISKGGGTDLMSRLIRWRTNSRCEHSMLGIHQGNFVWESAASWYGEGAMDSYMVADNVLKFYTLVNQTPSTILALQDYVAKRIASPWTNKLYDYLGILGQAIGFPKVHTPGLEYCSVDDIHALKSVASTLLTSDQLVINAIPNEENPGFLDLVMSSHPEIFCLYGIYTFTKPV